jgi:chromosome segregation ATPase
MEAARKPRLSTESGAGSSASLQESLTNRLLRPEDFAKVLRLNPNTERDRNGRNSAFNAEDLSSALDLVHEAAAVIRAADDRIRDIETRTQTLLQHAADELKAAGTRAQAAEAQVQNLEGRLRDAETRAEEAENWLRQIFSTISEELPARA